MMDVAVSLHSHSRDGSDDASLTEAEMGAVYRAHGFGPTAVTDHDAWTRASPGRLAGVERTLDAPSYLHVVELSDGFSFLAHPARPFPTNTRERAIEFVRDHGLDGVEKYNQGVEQYPGRIDEPDIVELANDDAHNGWQVGLSHMVVEAPDAAPRSVLRAIRRGDMTLVNRPDRRRMVVGKARQMVELGASTARCGVTPGSWVSF